MTLKEAERILLDAGWRVQESTLGALDGFPYKVQKKVTAEQIVELAKQISNERSEEVSGMTIGERIRKARLFLGFTQNDVAQTLGASRSTISTIEGGTRAVTTSELEQLSRLLRRPIEYFVDGYEGDTLTDEVFALIVKLEPGDKETILNFAKFLYHAGKPVTN